MQHHENHHDNDRRDDRIVDYLPAPSDTRPNVSRELLNDSWLALDKTAVLTPASFDSSGFFQGS